MRSCKLWLSLEDRKQLESCASSQLWAQCVEFYDIALMSPDEKEGFVFKIEERGGLLWDNSEPKWKPLEVDFLSSEWKSRVQRTWTSKELLRDALGAKHGDSFRIIDGTAGLWSDAFLCHIWGHRITAYEQHPLLAFMGNLAYEKFKNSEPDENEKFGSMQGRFSSFALKELLLESQKEKIDILYLDPIYPEKKKVALNKKELRMVKKLVGHAILDDPSLVNFVEACVPHVNRRIIVKRPIWSPELKRSSGSVRLVKGKTTRFDVFDCI